MNELAIKPEHECFDVGHVGSLWPLLDMGLLELPLHADFVMGVLGGIPASARNLAAMADNLPEGGNHWGVIGIGRVQWSLVAAALTLGGLDPRRPRGQLLPARRHDGPLQWRADRGGGRAHAAGRAPPATVEEARTMLGVKAMETHASWTASGDVGEANPLGAHP